MPPRAALALGLLLSCCAPAPQAQEAGPDRRSLQAGPLTIRYDPAFERVARDLAARAGPELERVGHALGLPLPETAEVHLLPRKGGTDPRAHGLPTGPDWSAGLTLGSRPVIVLRTAEDLDSLGASRVGQVFTHELVHLVAIQALDGRHGALPAWFQEGTASHLAFEWRWVDAGRALRFAVGGSFVPLSRLSRGFRGDPHAVADAYFQSRAFVGWLVDEHGTVKFRELWRRLAAGEGFDRAFFRTYGTAVVEQEEDWRRYFRRRYAWVPLLTSATTPWVFVSALVLLGWLRKKRRGRAKLAAWEEEERAEDLARERAAAAAGDGLDDDPPPAGRGSP